MKKIAAWFVMYLLASIVVGGFCMPNDAQGVEEVVRAFAAGACLVALMVAMGAAAAWAASVLE